MSNVLYKKLIDVPVKRRATRIGLGVEGVMQELEEFCMGLEPTVEHFLKMADYLPAYNYLWRYLCAKGFISSDGDLWAFHVDKFPEFPAEKTIEGGISWEVEDEVKIFRHLVLKVEGVDQGAETLLSDPEKHLTPRELYEVWKKYLEITERVIYLPRKRFFVALGNILPAEAGKRLNKDKRVERRGKRIRVVPGIALTCGSGDDLYALVIEDLNE